MEDILRRHRDSQPAVSAASTRSTPGARARLTRHRPRARPARPLSSHILLRIDPRRLAVHRRRAGAGRRWPAPRSPGCSPCRSSCSPRSSLFFFRDPESPGAPPAPTTSCCRRPTAACWSPGRRCPTPRPPGEWQQISIFLSPMDVHVNRMPASGRVTRVDVHAGAVPARVPPRRRDARTSAARSGSTTTARPSSRARSSASSRGASSAAPSAGAEVHAGDGSAS